MYDRNDATEPIYPHRGGDEETIETIDLLESRTQSATLPVGAAEAFNAFCDVQTVGHWVSVVSSVRILEKNERGRATRVAFMARLDGASIGYTLTYKYDEEAFRVSWTTARGSTTRVVGNAYFLPLGENASLMHYELSLDLPAEALPAWADPFFNTNAASAVVNDFRDFINRKIKPI
jgi:uncharacterized membrane protein